MILRILGGIATAAVLLATGSLAEAATPTAKQFFRPFALAKEVRSNRAPGVMSDAFPVQFNSDEMLGLRTGEEVELTLPDAVARTVVFELAQSHGGGIHSWVGHFKERGRNNRVILTSGPTGSYGTIDTPDGSYRVVPGNGHDWLVDMTEEQLHIPIRPAVDDVKIPPPSAKFAPFLLNQPSFQDALPGVNSVAKVTPSPLAVIDLMVVATQTLANRLGSNLMTRLHFLITRANTTYADSEVAMTLRLVKLAVVDYPESTSNDTALDAITPFSGGGTGVFANIESQRAAAGADLVSLMRDGSSFGGSGIAWIGGFQGAPYNPLFMYSVVTGCVSGCESVFIHELGHNMGNKHDRNTNAYQSGGTSGGTFPYSFGYAYCETGVLTCVPNIVSGTPGTCTTSQPECAVDSDSNFRDIMAYFLGSTQQLYRFSNPALLDCATANGDGVPRPCGINELLINSANTAFSMNNRRVAISAVKTQVSATQMPGSLQFTQPTFSGTESGGTITFTVSRVRDAAIVGGGGAVSVNYSLASGSATAGTDFVATPGTLNWSDGDFANKSFAATIQNDASPEPLETFTATLSDPSGAAGVFLGHPSSATGIIQSQLIFPPGGVLPAGWTTPSGTTWAVASDFADDADGTSLKSGNLFPACPPTCGLPAVPAASATQFAGNFTSGTVSFSYKVDSYPGFGFFEFLIDGVVALSDSGDSGWKFFSTPIGAGSHTLQWRYRPVLTFACRVAGPPPPQGSACADRAWIDAVNLPATVTPADPARLANISTRMQVLTGNNVMIGGFVVGGSTNKTVAIVVTGPSLAAFGITNPLANPTLQLVRSSDQSVIATNDDWGSAANAAQLQAAGFAPSNALESAILVSLPPGAYTAIVSGVGGGTGVGIVAVYEVDHPEVPLINISTRGQVLTGNDVMIGGFVIQGSGPQTVVVVATGPSLAAFGIANPLANPTLTLVRSSDQTVIATNDNWQSASNAAAISAAGFAPSNVLESAIMVSLAPGAYTAIVSGVGGGTGVGIVAVYTTP